MLKKKMMAAALALGMALIPTGCTVKASVEINTDSNNKPKTTTTQTTSGVAVSDAGRFADDFGDTRHALDVDDSRIQIDSSRPAIATVTATTDTGLTLQKTFPMVPSDPSGIPPVGASTLALAPANPEDVKAFIRGAAANASASLDIQAVVQTPLDDSGATGGSHTVVARSFHPDYGVAYHGSASYQRVIPPPRGGCHTRFCPNQ